MNATKKLKMDIRGNVRSSIFNLFHYANAKRLGVTTHSLKFHSPSHVEVIVEGEKDKLWKVVNSNRRGPMLCTVEELTFQFF